MNLMVKHPNKATIVIKKTHKKLHFVKRLLRNKCIFLQPEFVCKAARYNAAATPDIPDARAIQCTDLITF